MIKGPIEVLIDRVTLKDFKIRITCHDCLRNDIWVFYPTPENTMFSVSFGCEKCRERIRVKFWRTRWRYDFIWL